jgi:hypothetical protein
LGAGYEHDAVCLKALLFARVEIPIGLSTFIDEAAAQALAS